MIKDKYIREPPAVKEQYDGKTTKYQDQISSKSNNFTLSVDLVADKGSMFRNKSRKNFINVEKLVSFT